MSVTARLITKVLELVRKEIWRYTATQTKLLPKIDKIRIRKTIVVPAALNDISKEEQGVKYFELFGNCILIN